MPFCGNCGAPVNENEQCSRCGELCAEADLGAGLELDEHAARTPQSYGSADARPTAAQIGGEGGASELMSAAAEPPAPRPSPALAKPSLNFDERERSSRLLLWRVTRIPILLILGWFTASHLFLGSTWVFVDNVNLLVHEAGHVAFSWAGSTVHALGGTLGQLLLPAAFVVYFFWWRSERFAGVACVWWLGENLVPIAHYMKDAPTEELPLVGGGQHDWAYLYGKWGLLHRAQDIAEYFLWLGLLTMAATLAILIWWTVQPTSRELAPPPE